VVPWEEIIEKLWGKNAFLDTDNAINTAVRKIRHVLKDDPESLRFVQTITGTGYRFIAQVAETGVPAALETAPAQEKHADAPSPSPEVAAVSAGSDSAQAIIGPEIGNVTSSGKRWRVIVPAALAVLALSSAAYLHFHRTPKLTDKDTIVLADFTNSTGDPVFDGTLRQGLAVQLEQSPFLSIVSDDRIQQTINLMGRPPDTRLTPEVAREVCERTASAAVLDGSIASLGTEYVIGLRAQDCRTGDVLAEEQNQAAKKEDVLNALG